MNITVIEEKMGAWTTRPEVLPPTLSFFKGVLFACRGSSLEAGLRVCPALLCNGVCTSQILVTVRFP